MRPFWITSMGRTGTKWLATMLQVPHEPKDPPKPFRAASPMHLERWVLGWRPRPIDSFSFGVVVRDAHCQMLSVINRFYAVHPRPKERVSQWVNRVSTYLEIFQKLIDQGAVVIDYHRMTTQKDYLQRIADRFGCTLDTGRFEERINAFEPRKHLLTPPQAALAAVIQEHYDRWLNQHAM